MGSLADFFQTRDLLVDITWGFISTTLVPYQNLHGFGGAKKETKRIRLFSRSKAFARSSGGVGGQPKAQGAQLAAGDVQPVQVVRS